MSASPPDRSSRAGLLWWALPPLLLYAVYWKGLFVWFYQDDLTLIEHVLGPPHEFWPRLLEPRAQGTYRTLSERLYFFWFYRWFGLDAFPFRVLAFATQTLNLWLFGALLLAMKAPRPVAILAASFWAMHHGLAVTMSWSSAYNQALLSTFVLTALHMWGLFLSTGKLRYYLVQVVLFLIGFGALESVAAYPLLAVCYALTVAPRRWAWALPTFLGSIAMAAIQIQASARAAPDSSYRPDFHPLALASNLVYYIERALAAISAGWFALLLAAVLLTFALAEARRGRWIPLFGWGFFVAMTSPYLPLTNHRSDYYLFLPAAGLAIVFSCALWSTWNRPWRTRVVVVALMLGFFYPSLTYSGIVLNHNLRTSLRCRNLVTGLRYARARHPDKTILLTSIDDIFFYASIYHDLFKLSGVWDVYLAPDANSVRQHTDRADISRFLMPPDDALRATLRNDVVVYDASGMRLREITSLYRAYAPARLQAMPATRP